MIHRIHKHLQKNPQLKREIFSFILIGILGTATDFVIYWCLHHYLPYSISKTISFILGSCVAYLLNKFITYQQKQHSTSEIIRFTILYGSSMAINVAVNSASIMLLRHILMTLPIITLQMIIVLSFVIATGVSTIINFIGQRFWVFKRSKYIEVTSLV